MLIAVQELQQHPLHVEKEYAAGEIEVQQPDLERIGPLKVQADARLSGPEIRVHLRIDGIASPNCARCLQPVALPLAHDVRLVYHPVSELTAVNEVEIHTADTEVGFFRGEGVELEDIVREQVLLALPMRTMCNEECRGLCPTCGSNLNHETCDCDKR